jgi:hypothetical protein
MRSSTTLALSCGARSAFELMGKSYLRNMLSRRQLQGFVVRRTLITDITHQKRTLAHITRIEDISEATANIHEWHIMP